MTSEPKTVLIVDDDKLVLAAYKYAFERADFQVVVAENGNRAMAALAKCPVDVMFLDILMPDKEGLETLLEIRQRYADLPVYVMSGGGLQAKQDFLSVAEKFGATGTIRKPVLAAELIKIAEACSPRGGRLSEQRAG
jgi:DNA-binding NtrC family response regulator